MVKRRDVRVALPQVGGFLCVGKPELFEKAERVAVPSRHINIASDVVVIEFGEEAHEVVRDIAARRMLPQDIDLFAVEPGYFPRSKPAIVEPVRGVGLGHGQIGSVNLIKGTVFHAPEDIAPCLV